LGGEEPRALGARSPRARRARPRRALALSRARGTLRWEPPSLIALARGRIAQLGAAAQRDVEDHLAQAESRARAEGGPHIVLPEIFEARAELASALGESDERQRHLREAHRLYAEMGADGHAARLARVLG
jgi:hypothetical protein